MKLGAAGFALPCPRQPFVLHLVKLSELDYLFGRVILGRYFKEVWQTKLAWLRVCHNLMLIVFLRPYLANTPFSFDIFTFFSSFNIVDGISFV